MTRAELNREWQLAFAALNIALGQPASIRRQQAIVAACDRMKEAAETWPSDGVYYLTVEETASKVGLLWPEGILRAKGRAT